MALGLINNRFVLQFKSDKYAFNYLEAGKGESLVFVHGSASDYRSWSHQYEFFSKEFHTIVYSRRYHFPNREISAGEDYSMAGHVNDLDALILNMSSPPAHIIGHSYGAFIALLLALKNPSIINSLVLTEPPVLTLYVSKDPTPPELFRLLPKRPGLAIAILKFGIKGVVPAKAAISANNMNKALEIFGRATLGTKTFDNLPETRLKIAGQNFVPAELTGSGFPPLDSNKIRAIKVPVLLLTGEKSPGLFRGLMNGLEELLPNAQRIMVSGASHIVHEDNPAEFNKVVRAFLMKGEA